MDYRREIDGLRALAIIPVLLFHAGFETFSGGFVGVDVFFVISGYLITSIILLELEAGTFTLAGFYERRARRILPALFIVTLACIPAAWAWLLPREMKDFAESLFAVSVFLSNHLFLSESGYFENAAETKPLLHTWSLAVEEQYYLLFPLFLRIIWLSGNKHRVLPITLTMAACSLALAEILIRTKPEAAFFLLPTRAWELLLGSLMAFRPRRASPPPTIPEQIGAASGLALISYAIFFYSKTTPFPGLHALAPTLGTALIIAYGTHSTVVGKLLGCRLLVGIGLISYSAYLWHQPIFAFTRQISPLPPSSRIMSGLTLAALAAAYYSWKYVETPFRNKAAFSRHQIFIYSAIGSLFLIGIGIAGHATDGFKQRLTDAQKTLVAFEKYDYETIYRSGNCFVDSRKTNESFADSCHSGNLSGDVLLWGDSHAAALSFGLRQIGSISQFTSSGCVPIPSQTGDQSDRCRQLNAFIQNTIRQTRPAAVILHANWSRYSQYMLQSELRETIQFIRSAAPGASITIIGSVPQWSPSLPALLAQKYGHIEKAGMAYNAKISELNELDQQLKQLSTEDGVTFLSALDALCHDDECQATVRTETNLTLTAWDYGHLTGEGSILLASRLFPHGLSHLTINPDL